MSAILDLFRGLEEYFQSLSPEAQAFLGTIAIYSLSFLVIRFFIFVYCRLRHNELTGAAATELSMLVATFLWPAFLAILIVIFLDGEHLLDRAALVFTAWFGATLLIAPVSSAMGLLFFVVYLEKAKRLSPKTIYIFVPAIMFLQFLYLIYVDFDLGSKQ